MAPFIFLLFLLLSSASANDVEDAKKDDPNLKIESSKEAGKEDGKELKDDYDWKGHEEKKKEKEKTLEDEKNCEMSRIWRKYPCKKFAGWRKKKMHFFAKPNLFGKIYATF